MSGPKLCDIATDLPASGGRGFPRICVAVCPTDMWLTHLSWACFGLKTGPQQDSLIQFAHNHWYPTAELASVMLS